MNETQLQTFFCADCHQDKPISGNGGTGYAELTEGGQLKRICYSCIAPRDKADMIQTGKAVLYFTNSDPTIKNGKFRFGTFGEARLTNWPGTLSFQARFKLGRHNIARSRYDVWFTGPDGNPWHGVQYGEFSQLTRCRRIKTK